jgi:NADPH-dependent 2,4-dienoyl-CoA reductase/sulfur reductase-like enzyme
MNRRHFLAASAAIGASLTASAAPLTGSAAAELLPTPKGKRVVIVGGGWGGLSAARHLRKIAPDLEIVLLEKNAAFWSHPQSNKWLVGLSDGRHLVHDYLAAASAYGYTFIRGEVTAIERDKRRVVTDQGSLGYDWLILAVGIRYDFAPWYGNDRRAAEHTQQNYPGAFIGGEETRALKKKLEGFAGGDLVMTIPSMPYRCPPAPYERACMIGWWLKTRKIKGKLIVLDPNPIALGFDRVYRQYYADQIVYVPQAAVKSVDPFGKIISTDFDTIKFDDAILMAPQQASDLVWQAGLIAKDSAGKPTGWADQDPVHLHARGDDRVFLIGDLIDKASSLFGHYPKSGHLANRLGRIAAQEVAARAQGLEPEAQLPDSVCYVHANVEPMEMIRIDAHYRLRGDGLIVQTVKQSYDPNPRGEDVQWAEAMYGEFLAFKP